MAKKDKEVPQGPAEAPSTPRADFGISPERISSSDVPPGELPAPRVTRFGGGKEGAGERRERGQTGRRENFFSRTAQFLHDVRVEMGRVSWPTANQVKNTTIITVIAVLFFALYLFAVDQILTFLITQLESLVNWLFGAV